MRRWTDIHSDPSGWIEIDVVGVENVRTRALPKPMRGYQPCQSRLSAKDIAAIRDAYSNSDDTVVAIGKRFGVSHGTVHRVVCNKHSRRSAA